MFASLGCGLAGKPNLAASERLVHTEKGALAAGSGWQQGPPDSGAGAWLGESSSEAHMECVVLVASLHKRGLPMLRKELHSLEQTWK